MLVRIIGRVVQAAADIVRKLLESLANGVNLNDYLGQTIDVLTKFGPVSGTLLDINLDYLVLESAENQYIYVPYENIQTIEVED